LIPLVLIGVIEKFPFRFKCYIFQHGHSLAAQPRCCLTDGFTSQPPPTSQSRISPQQRYKSMKVRSCSQSTAHLLPTWEFWRFSEYFQKFGIFSCSHRAEWVG
jgi:hypothetical protein